MTPPPDAPTAVIALGGNALAPAGEKSTIYDQFRHTRESLGPIVDLARNGWNVCVVHGNGPQVGALGVDRFQADRLWWRKDEQLAGLWPQRSRERDGDSVLFVRHGEIYTIAPRSGQSPKVLGLDAPGPMSAPA